MSIKHAELRPEVLTLVNSNLAKYDPNNNNTVDDGDELSQLLSEYQVSEKTLKEGKGQIYTTAEQMVIEEAKARNKENNFFTGLGASALGIIGAAIGGGAASDGNLIPILKNAKITKKLGATFVGAALGLAIPVISAVTAIICNNKTAEKDAIRAMKAEQAEKGSQEMANRRKKAEELRKREEALKQEELEYKERMDKATTGIESNINGANKKAKNLNRELDKATKKVKEVAPKTEETDAETEKV